MVGDSPKTLAPIRPDLPEPETPKHRGAPEEEEMRGERLQQPDYNKEN